MTEFIDRWRNPEFLAKNRCHLEEVFRGRNFSRAVDLRGLTVGIEGPVELAVGSHFQESIISNVDFSYSKFSCSFWGGIFHNIDYSKSMFDTCSMASAKFTHCRFLEARFFSPEFDESIFRECSFTSIRCSGRLLLGYGGRNAIFEGCDFAGAKMSMLEFRGCEFTNCVFEGAEFERCFVFGNKFVGKAPSEKQFDRCEFRGRNIGLTWHPTGKLANNGA